MRRHRVHDVARLMTCSVVAIVCLRSLLTWRVVVVGGSRAIVVGGGGETVAGGGGGVGAHCSHGVGTRFRQWNGGGGGYPRSCRWRL